MGYLKEATDTNAAMKQLEKHIVAFPQLFNQLREEDILQKPAPGKWSKKEILGHLVDSAINNLKRFTEAQFLPQPFTVIPYQQEELVIVNNYQNLPLEHLLTLWQALNRQIVFVVRNIPKQKLSYPVDPQYENKEIMTLEWIICDYVAHMEHHFKQIFPSNS